MSTKLNAETEEFENFYGVYLLVSQSTNSRFKGRTYVGFTVDPIRRLKQHNGGSEAGGAKRTSNRGPWAMVLIIYGFPNMVSALRFEWAWQHPKRSRRLNHLPLKKKNENSFQYHINIVSSMINVGPWNRLPLNIRWIRPDLKGKVDFNKSLPPPMHMAISYGPIAAKKAKLTKSKKANDIVVDWPEEVITEDNICGLCTQNFSSKEEIVSCISPKCKTISHIACLAQHFRETSQEKNKLDYLLPIDGTCPVCDFHCLWGDIVKKKKGFFEDLPFKLASSDEEQLDSDN